MKIRSNWFLAAVAFALAAYVWFVERRAGPLVSGAGGVAATFAPIIAEELTGLELASSNRVLGVQRAPANGKWTLRVPFEAAAEQSRIETLARALASLRPSTYIGPAEVAAAGGARAFGMEGPLASHLTLRLGARPPILLNLGERTLGGTRFYLQRIGNPGVFVADRAVLDALPKTVDDWRNRALITQPAEGFDRLELKGATEFRAERDSTGNWRLKRPLDARAHTERINSLIALLAQTRITEFISDRPIIDLEAYNLQKPLVELTLGRGANERVHLQFGGVVSNDPAHRFVSRLSTTNLVTIPSGVVEMFQQPLAAYRDRRLLPEVTETTRLEYQGPPGDPGFVIERVPVTGTNWFVTAPVHFAADASIIAYFFRQFAQFEIADFPADVVTDLTRYGLATPLRSYQMTAGTNLIALLQLGSRVTNRPTLLHARRSDEASVYALPVSVLGQLPEAAAQLRDWHFVATNTWQISVARGGLSGTFVRTNGGWEGPRGRLDSIVAGNLDATIDGLGALRSNRFVLMDSQQEKQFRNNYHVAPATTPLAFTITLRPDAARGFRTWRVEFGSELGAARVVLARFDTDSTPLRLEVPIILFEDLLRDLVW